MTGVWERSPRNSQGHMVRGIFAIGAWASTRPTFGPRSAAFGIADQGGLRYTALTKAWGCSTAGSRPGHQVGRAAAGWKSKHQG